ncbi:helix-turn-helix transcriptional regulator [Erysipelotrichaceae bacterium 66-17]
MATAKEIGRRIKALREKRNLTRKELAKIVDVEESAISNYENGIRIPLDVIKPKIAEALRTDIIDLFFKE